MIAPLNCLYCHHRIDYDFGNAECSLCDLMYSFDETISMASKPIQVNDDEEMSCAWVHWNFDENLKVNYCEYVSEFGDSTEIPFNTPFDIDLKRLTILLTFG